MAIYSGGMAASASWLANMSQNVRGGESHAAPIDYAPEAYFAEPANASSGNESEPVAQVRTPCFRAGREQAKHGLSGVGAGMMGAGAAVMNRFGSVARFIGHAVVEGSGDGSGSVGDGLIEGSGGTSDKDAGDALTLRADAVAANVSHATRQLATITTRDTPSVNLVSLSKEQRRLRGHYWFTNLKKHGHRGGRWFCGLTHTRNGAGAGIRTPDSRFKRPLL